MVLRKMLLLFLVSFLCILSCKNGTAPDDDTKSVVLQNGLNGYAGCIDSHIYFKGDAPDSQTTNFASRAVLKTTNCPTWGPEDARAVIKFDLTSNPDIPSNVNDIISAELSLYFCSAIGMEGKACSLYVLSSDWDVSSVTWMNKNASTPWTVAGGEFVTAPESFIPFAAMFGWETFDVTSAVKNLITNPQSNYGFIIKVALNNKGHYYYSSDYADDSTLRPKLTLTVKK